MTNNHVFKQLLFLSGLNKKKDLTLQIFKLGGVNASQSKIKAWRTELDNPRASHMSDGVLEGFITGLFEYKKLVNQNALSI